MKQGYVYAAFGTKYIDEAKVSAKSLRAVEPSAHITLFTDNQLSIEGFDHIREIELPTNSGERNEFGYLKDGFSLKIAALCESPYNKTCFVDTDTFFLDSCSELFDYLDHYDILAAQDPSDDSQIEIEGKVYANYFAYNTGVICYNQNEKVQSFLRSWMRSWQENIGYFLTDQTAFMYSLINSQIKMYALSPLYNFRFQFFVSVKGRVKVLHGRHTNLELLGKKINEYVGQRTWDYQLEELIHNNKPRGWKAKLIAILPKSLYAKYRSLMNKD